LWNSVTSDVDLLGVELFRTQSYFRMAMKSVGLDLQRLQVWGHSGDSWTRKELAKAGQRASTV
jgi:hypothetical protein